MAVNRIAKRDLARGWVGWLDMYEEKVVPLKAALCVWNGTGVDAADERSDVQRWS